MATYGRCEDLTSLVVNPNSFLPEMAIDKVHLLLVESRMMREDYNREVVINYISGNYSSNKHLCNTILSGKDDATILELLEFIEETITEEIEARKRNGLPSF
ncbi:MAG: hypothetical protein J6U12_05180 [Candidatus Methanomethylophilaceae archaeon]|nr:hypothetical protein [Candidatus Methanomethylophilaceae archaeon]